MITTFSSKPGGVFIIGMRRTGTSILRRILEVGTGGCFLFEPHEMWFAIRRAHIERITRTAAFIEAKKAIKKHFDAPGICGVKFAFDPGIEMFEWRWIEKRFRSPRYVFIRRNRRDTYASYYKHDRDTVRGVTPDHIHSHYWAALYEDLSQFTKAHQRRAIMIDYEDLVLRPLDTLTLVFEHVGVTADINELSSMVCMPENKEALVNE